jgi:pre-mRNA-processing factor 19
MRCGISGDVPQEPVVTRNGIVYEKSLILKQIRSNGVCPVTNEPLGEEDLIHVVIDNQDAVRPRPLTATSISGLLGTLQNEWDALMLETFNLKKQLDTSRRELSHALYQNDAACRVIARLIKERDQARDELEKWKRDVGAGGNFQTRDLPPEVLQALQDKLKVLSQARREMALPVDLATRDQLHSYKCAGSILAHKINNPGTLCIDIHPTKPFIVTGGMDSTAIIYDINENKKLATLAGHEDSINSVVFHPSDAVFTGSADTTVKVWTPKGNSYECYNTFTDHKAPVVAVDLHPTGTYILTASKDSSWGFYDFDRGVLLTQVLEPERAPFNCAKIHPDGVIFASGSEGNLVRIWDLRNQKNVATFQHQGPVISVDFSENGYYLVSGSEDNTVKVWDLRGGRSSNVSTLLLEEAPMSVKYDKSGSYLAVGVGQEIRIFSEVSNGDSKDLSHIATYADHSDVVTEVKFGTDANFLVSSSLESEVKIWRQT